jgi:hypothetical protein
MVANATFGRAFVGIVAVVQDVLLDVAEDRLGWVIVRTPLGMLVQCNRNCRIVRRVIRALMGCAGSRSKPIRTIRRGYHRRTRRRKRQTYFAPLPG